MTESSTLKNNFWLWWAHSTMFFFGWTPQCICMIRIMPYLVKIWFEGGDLFRAGANTTKCVKIGARNCCEWVEPELPPQNDIMKLNLERRSKDENHETRNISNPPAAISMQSFIAAVPCLYPRRTKDQALRAKFFEDFTTKEIDCFWSRR